MHRSSELATRHSKSYRRQFVRHVALHDDCRLRLRCTVQKPHPALLAPPKLILHLYANWKISTHTVELQHHLRLVMDDYESDTVAEPTFDPRLAAIEDLLSTRSDHRHPPIK